MVKRLKGVLILSLSVLALNGNANTHYESKDKLIIKSRDLAETIVSLVANQEKRVCAEKLVLASSQIEMAANWMVGDAYLAAKKDLDTAVSALQYAELNNCNRYIQISHAKFETKRIKQSL